MSAELAPLGSLGRDEPPRRILVFRALQLGDLLCAVPALRALRAAFPEATVSLVGIPNAAPFAQRYSHYVDELLPFPGFPGLPETVPALRELPYFLRRVQRRGFDLAIQMHGDGSLTNSIVMLCGARRSAGFYQPGRYRPDEQTFMPYPNDTPEIRRPLRLLRALGVPTCGEAIDFPLHAADLEEAEAILTSHGLASEPYVCIHPGARAADRRWPPESFARTVDAMARRGLRTVLTGSADEALLVERVANACYMRPINLAGQTTLGGLAGILSGARMLVCNDTGVSHVAAALGTPSVVIFAASDPRRWAPLDADRHRVVAVRSPGQLGGLVEGAAVGGFATRGDAGLAEVVAHADDLLRAEFRRAS